MAFDIMSMFGQQALNRLLQPIQNGEGAQNFLANPQSAQASVAAPPLLPPVEIGPAPQVASPQPDPMQTASVAAPPQTAAITPAPAMASPQAPQKKGLRERLDAFGNSDRGQFLQDMFLGWTMGGTPGESLAMGATMAGRGRRDRKDRNETVEWLKGRGFDEPTAKRMASNPTVLADYLKNMNAANDPMTVLDKKYKQAQIDKLNREASGVPNASSSFGNLDAQARAAGLEPGTSDYQSFMLNGGGAPATFRALEMQAQAAGFEPGSPEYTEFMATRGAGLSAGAARTAQNQADIQTGGDAEREKAAGREEGKGQGEAMVSYRSMMSKLPGLEQVIGELNGLADQATYTYAGRALDAVRQQAGAEPRDAAVARTKYISMVDNQILPLLRDTFGAQFTVQEGDALRATLGDPNKTPTEKKEVLDAFIGQKRRDVEALALQAMGGAGGNPVQNTPAGGGIAVQAAPAGGGSRTSSGIGWSLEP